MNEKLKPFLIHSRSLGIRESKSDVGQTWKGCHNARWVKKGFYNLGFREKEQW